MEVTSIEMSTGESSFFSLFFGLYNNRKVALSKHCVAASYFSMSIDEASTGKFPGKSQIKNKANSWPVWH